MRENLGSSRAPTEAVDGGNKTRILQALRREPGMSKSRLARHLNLGVGTVSVLSTELIDAGLVVPQGYQPSTGGRPPRGLALNAKRPLMLGIDLGETDARLGVLSLEGQLRTCERHPFRRTDGEIELEPILAAAQRITRASSDIEGVGIAVPGQLDLQHERVIRAANLGWHDLALRARAEEALDLPVAIERNTSAALLAEEWWGQADAGDPFVFVTLGSGIGAAIKINGRFVRGASSAAGEFGHIPLDSDGPPCQCGKHGCLETLASVPALLSLYQRLRSGAAQSGADSGGDVTVEAMAARAGRDDAAAQALDHVASQLGRGLATLVSLINPGVIVLGGELMDAQDIILPRVREVTHRLSAVFARDTVQVLPSTFHDRAAVIGAATLAFERLFTSA